MVVPEWSGGNGFVAAERGVWRGNWRFLSPLDLEKSYESAGFSKKNVP
jgi:hypothetical protein